METVRLIGDETGDHTDDKTRTVSNGLGDETGSIGIMRRRPTYNLQDSLQKLSSGTATPPAMGLPPMPKADNHDAAATTNRIMWDTPAMRAVAQRCDQRTPCRHLLAEVVPVSAAGSSESAASAPQVRSG